MLLQKSKMQTFGNKKKKFQLIHFRNCYFFIYVFFSEKASVFHRSIPYGNHSGEIVARNNLVEDSYGAF